MNWGTSMLQLLKRYWAVIRRPSVHFSLGFLTIGGFIAGILFWGAFNTAMEVTNTIKAAATSAIPAHSDGRSGLMQVFDPTTYSAT